MVNLGIIIVNHKSRGLTRNCLLSLQDDLKTFSGTVGICVVNSGADQPTTEMVSAQFPNVQVLTKENSGYPSAVNEGISNLDAEYYLILNPDIMLLEGGILQRLYEYMQQHPQVGICAPRLLNPDGTKQFSARKFPPTFLPLYARTPLGKSARVKKTMRAYLMMHASDVDAEEVDWVLGSTMLVRKRMIDEIGGMDQHFFMYFEDVDWCRRAWEKGWRIVVLNTVRVVHFHTRDSAEGGISSLAKKTTREHIKSWVYYVRKYRGKPLPRA